MSLENAQRRIVRAITGLVDDVKHLSWTFPLVGGAEVHVTVEGGTLKGYAGADGSYSLSLMKGATEYLIICSHLTDRHGYVPRRSDSDNWSEEGAITDSTPVRSNTEMVEQIAADIKRNMRGNR